MASLLVDQFIVKEDLSDFTVNKWRNKIFTDPRVRSKLKDKNYKVKIIEDIELTRNAVLKVLAHEKLTLLNEALSVGPETVIFSGSSTKNYQWPYRVAVKVWNKPAKQLMESKLEYYEHDNEFTSLIQKSNPAEFPTLWIERHVKLCEKLLKNSIKCPKPIYTTKNVLVMELMEGGTLEDALETLKATERYSSIERPYNCIKLILRQLYQNGLIYKNFTGRGIDENGLIFDVCNLVPKSLPEGPKILLTTCQKLITLFKSYGMNTKEIIAESLFQEITGYDYSQYKPPVVVKEEDPQIGLRKLERKSERSSNNSKSKKV